MSYKPLQLPEILQEALDNGHCCGYYTTSTCVVESIEKNRNYDEVFNVFKAPSNLQLESTGTKYTGMTMYFTLNTTKTTIQHNDTEYILPDRVIIECYEETRNALQCKVFNNYAITDKQLNDFRKDFCNKEHTIIIIPLEITGDFMTAWLSFTNGYVDDSHTYLPFGGIIYATKK